MFLLLETGVYVYERERRVLRVSESDLCNWWLHPVGPGWNLFEITIQK